MKKWISMIGLILTLTGCAVKEPPVFEYVTDIIPRQAMPSWRMEISLPSGLIQSASAEDGRLAIFLEERYEVIQQILPAESAADALRQATGLDSPFTLCLQTAPNECWRYSFSSTSEEGPLLTQGILFFDGSFGYTLSAQCPEAQAPALRETFSEMFQSARLLPAE